MTDERVEQLRHWALAEMAWARAEAEENGKKIKPIKGVRNMRTAVEAALAAKTKPKVRALAAVEIIAEYVTEAYGLKSVA